MIALRRHYASPLRCAIFDYFRADTLFAIHITVTFHYAARSDSAVLFFAMMRHTPAPLATFSPPAFAPLRLLRWLISLLLTLALSPCYCRCQITILLMLLIRLITLMPPVFATTLFAAATPPPPPLLALSAERLRASLRRYLQRHLLPCYFTLITALRAITTPGHASGFAIRRFALAPLPLRLRPPPLRQADASCHFRRRRRYAAPYCRRRHFAAVAPAAAISFRHADITRHCRFRRLAFLPLAISPILSPLMAAAIFEPPFRRFRH